MAVGTPGVGLGPGISKEVVELFWVRVAIGHPDHERSEIRILKHCVDGWWNHGSLGIYLPVGEGIRIRLNALRPSGTGR